MILSAGSISADSILLISQVCASVFLFVSGIYFLIHREKRLHRLLSGILLFWFLLHMKDLLLLDGTASCPYLERLCICIDILAVPSCAFLLFELTCPGWFSWRRALLHELPFLSFSVMFGIFPNNVIFILDIFVALIYALHVILRLFQTIPEYNRILRKNFSNTENLDLEWLWKLLVFFILFLSIWAYSALQLSTGADTLYNLASLILWSVICCKIHKQQPLVLTGMAETAGTAEADCEASRPEFAAELERLFENQRIWLNPRLTIGEVAQQLGTNRTYVADAVAACTEQRWSVSQYVAAVRVRRARYLIDNHPELSLGEIGHVCGFQSQSSFIRCYRDHYGITPGEYRKFSSSRQ